MEPLNDRDLDELLMAWRAPSAPASLERRIDAARHKPRWTWIFTGSIRVPVPVTLLFAAAFLTLVFLLLGRTSNKVNRDSSRRAALAGFQPVRRLQPRIVRSSYEDN